MLVSGHVGDVCVVCGQGFKAVGVVERSVKVLPSSQAASITVTYLKDEKTETPIKSGQDISVVAGELLCGLSKWPVIVVVIVTFITCNCHDYCLDLCHIIVWSLLQTLSVSVIVFFVTTNRTSHQSK